MLRLEEARLLIDQRQDWDGAYYLAGYAVEFALKIRIIAWMIQSNSFPNKKLVDGYKDNLTGGPDSGVHYSQFIIYASKK